jgi:hypothetical protein
MSLGQVWGQGMFETLIDIGKSSASLEEHLGKPVDLVDTLVLQLAIDTNKAEWLRGAWRNQHLPRYRSDIGFSCFTCYEMTIPMFEKSEVIIWIIENLKGSWMIQNNRVIFDQDYDAVLYLLRWG